MRVDELLEGIAALDMANLFPDMEVAGVTSDSRQIQPGMAFVAIPGTKVDGHDYVEQALAAGATLAVVSRPLSPLAAGSFLRVADPRETYALLAARLAGDPSRKLRVIGVTGTNGKTSTTLIARHLLNCAGHRAAALGTLGLLKPGATEFIERGLTTPDAAKLQQLMRGLVDEGATHLVMEVSSHALAQERVAGVEFAGGVFTNLTQDHFDYHRTFEEYRDAKALLFTKHLALSGGYAVLNCDDPTGREYRQHFGGICATYGSQLEFNLVCREVSISLAGLDVDVVVKNGVWPETLNRNINSARLHSSLTGRYNVYNCLAAAGVALLEGLALTQVVEGLASFAGVPGRLERVPNPRGIHVFVDYAHTPDALNNVLAAVRELKDQSARVITVVGCGGDRDREKRPLMGAAAQQASDLLVVTSDNPRSEDPEAIIDEICQGLDLSRGEVQRISDRRLAIHRALESAQPGDVVLIAGKGHEDYQILNDRTIHFSDLEEVKTYFIGKS